MLIATVLGGTAPAAWAYDVLDGAPPCDGPAVVHTVVRAMNNDRWLITHALAAVSLMVVPSNDPDATPTSKRRYCSGILSLSDGRRTIVDFAVGVTPNDPNGNFEVVTSQWSNNHGAMILYAPASHD